MEEIRYGYILVENLKGRDLSDLGVDRRIILK
jgi:hypothetical protein